MNYPDPRPWWCPRLLWALTTRRELKLRLIRHQILFAFDNQRWAHDAIYTDKTFEEMESYDPMNHLAELSKVARWAAGERT